MIFNSLNSKLDIMKHFLLFLAISLVCSNALFSQDFEYITPEDDGLLPGLMYEIVFDSAGNTWACTWINPNGPGIAKLDGTTWSTIAREDGANSNHLVSILEDSNGNLWFGSDFPDNEDIPLGRFDGTSWTNFDLLDGAVSVVLDIIEDSDGIIWFATNAGAFAYDGTAFTQFTTDDGLSSNSTSSVTEDADGNIWFGTANSGASRFDGEDWEIFTETDGLASNEVGVVFADDNGLLWFGSGFSNTGLTSYDGSTFTIYTTADGLADNNVRYIEQDTEGNLWFAGSFGISRFDGTSWFVINNTNGLLDNLVRSITQAPNGDIWIGSFDGISVLQAGSLNTDEEIFDMFTAFPVPVKDTLQIQKNGGSLDIDSIAIYDLLGKELSSVINSNSIDMSSLSSGIYLVLVRDLSGNSQTLRIIKE